ncbi:HAMP domain-containing sensor histidine kinase [Paenibacillus tarimensis]|uniref:HAMP domain-containing sensor histidine kinase n=1 Tax=Paenibacillus tarimensis TaxID=416012 RepID=UPI001F3751AB|nr:HAMP domain-containing sensor histidine kinase [Paenibacillus tarimensis]MCF2945777.1 HAMP domain-containing histidine kinase [Paenibacillus tarimensis]
MSSRKLVTSLTKSFVFFGLTIGIINGLLSYYMQEWLVIGRASELTAGELVQPDYWQISAGPIEAAGGRVEVLNHDGQRVMAAGRPGGQESYSPEELLQLVSEGNESGYRHTIASFTGEDGESYRLLAVMPAAANYAQLHLNFPLLLLFALCVVIYSRWTARRITRPLEMMVKAIRRIRSGHYSERLSFQANAELMQIQEHLNEMSINLERTEREKRELEQSRQRMLLDLSHDLKTPITNIQGYAKALQLEMADTPEKRQQYLDIIVSKAGIVTSLIEDMFQLAILDSPDYPYAPEEVDLAELLRQTAIEYYDQFERKGIMLSVNIPESKVVVRMDRKLLYRAVANLLSNALKHNEPGTEAGLVLELTANWASIQVKDNGVKIPDEVKAELFQPFMRGDKVRKSGEGTGLGLAIARRAVERHGGTLNLREDGSGKTFEIMLFFNRQAG